MTKAERAAARAEQKRQAAESAKRQSASVEKPAAAPKKKGAKAPAAKPELTVQEKAEQIIEDEMFEAGSIPSSALVNSKLKALTGKGLSNGSPAQKALMNKLRKAWMTRFPPESGIPSGFFVGSVDGSTMKAVPKSQKAINDAGGKVPFKVVNGERVGFFTNDPVEVAKQINAGLKVTVPAELRSKIAPGIEIDQTTGEVTAAYDFSRGDTAVKEAGDWKRLYDNSLQKAERAEALLVEGENVLKETGKTLEELTDDLRRVTNRINAATSGARTITPAVLAESKKEQKVLIRQVTAVTKAQNPRIPFVGTDAFLAEHAPARVEGEDVLLGAVLQLGARADTSAGVDEMGRTYVENLARKVVELEWPSLADSKLMEVIEGAIRNEATVRARKLLMQNPGVDPATLIPRFPNMYRVAFDVVKKFGEADRAWRKDIAGSIDEELSTADVLTAGLAMETAQVDAEALAERMGEDEAAATPLSEGEIDLLRTGLQSMNDGNPDEFSLGLLKSRPLQARRALATMEKGLEFKVGADGNLIFEYGPELKTDELKALDTLLDGVVPPGSTDLLERYAARPNIARFFIDMAHLGREALKGVKTRAGAPMFSAKDLQKMNLIEVFEAVHAGDQTTAGLIIKQAGQNLATYADFANLNMAEARIALKALFSETIKPVEVRGRAAAPTSVAEQRAQEKIASLQGNVEGFQAVVNFSKAELDRLKERNRVLKDKADGLNEQRKKIDAKKQPKQAAEIQRELNKANAAIATNQQSIVETERTLADATKDLEAATKAYAAVTVRKTPPPAPVVAAAKAKVDETMKAAEKKAEVKRRRKTSPAPTKAVNAGLAMAPETPTPVNTEAERAAFKSELDVLGLSPDTTDTVSLGDALRRLSVKGDVLTPYQKALAKLFSDKVGRPGGVDAVVVIDNPALGADVSVSNGVITLNVAAMTPTLDGSPRGPEALMRGLITHFATTLTAPDAVLNADQQAALKKLEALREEAVAMEAQTRAPGMQPRFPDALKDTASFMQAMLTSPEFAEMLQSYKTKITNPGLKSAWGRFWAALGELLTGKALPFGSTLHVGLMTAGDLMVKSPAPNKRFLDTLRAVLHNPEVAFPKTRTASAEETAHQQRANEAVEVADSPESIETVEARLMGDDSASADPEGTSEGNAALMPEDSVLGSAPATAEAGEPRVKKAPRVRKKKPVAAPPLTEQDAFAGLAPVFRLVNLLDRVARGLLGMAEVAESPPIKVPAAIEQLNAAIERLQGAAAANKAEFIAKLEGMRAFLESERARVEAGDAPAAPASDEVSTTAEEVDADALPDESDIPMAEIDEDALPFAEPYIEIVAEDGSTQPLDFGPFLSRAAVKTGREVAMVDAGPGVPEQPLYVSHDRSDTTIYLNKQAMTALVEKLRSLGYSTEETTAYLNALLDREASTLAILQRFSDGELLATARSLTPDQRRKIIKSVYGLKPGDPGYMNYFSTGRSGSSQDVTADMIQLGADYYRMMRQVAETGHTTEDVMDAIASSPGTFARTAAFLRATANQFLTWWRAYGDVNATRAILNIEGFLQAATPGVPLASPMKKSVAKHEAAKLVAKRTGRSVNEVLADVKAMKRIRKSMKQHVLGSDTPETTPMTVAEARAFVEALGLVNRDPASVATALARIADMDSVNPAFRVIARQLSQNPQVAALADFTFLTNVTTLVEGEERPAAGTYDKTDNTLSLDLPFMVEEFAATTKPDQRTGFSQAFIVETLIHEAVHAVTARAVNDYSTGAPISPQTKDAVEGLVALRAEIANQKGADQFSYQLSNIDEFIAAVSSDPNFVAWLASLPPSVGASVPGETGKLSIVKRILRRIYQIIFPDMELDSVLEKSLSRVFDLAAYPHLAQNPSKKALDSIYRAKLLGTALRRKQEADAAKAKQIEMEKSVFDDDLDDIDDEMAEAADALMDDELTPEEELALEAEEFVAEAEAALDEYGRRQLLALPFPLYHGTPHKVERFLLSKIGSGEGAQVYGYGLYFAQKKEVAESYREGLTKREAFRGATPLAQRAIALMAGRSRDDAIAAAQENMQALWQKYDDFRTGRAGYTVSNEARYLEELQADVKAAKALWDLVRTPMSRWGKDALPEAQPGNLYTVEILPEDEEFLDWDKPLREQNAKIQNFFTEKYLSGTVPWWMARYGDFSDATGQVIYQALVSISPEGTDPSASKMLAEAGIPGIRYLDEGSRGQDEGTRNYVIFDENLIKITEENGNPVNTEGLGSVLYPESPSVLASPAKLPPTARYLPGRVTGERKTTEALKNSLPAMPSRVQDYLQESTYFSEVSKSNLELINGLIGPHLAAASGPADFRTLHDKLDDMPFTDAQRFLARVVVGGALNRRIFDLQEAMVKSATPGGLGLLSDYEDAAKHVWHDVQNIASTSGQMLSAAAIARDLLNPKYVAATYRDAATKVAATKLPKEVKDAFGDLQKEADKVAEGVVKKSPLLKKIVEALTKSTGGDPAEVKLVEDFLSKLEKLSEKATATSDLSIFEQMAEWVSDRMVGMVDAKVRAEVKKAADAAGVSEETFFEEYSNEVKRLLAERINTVLQTLTPPRPELTAEQRAQANKDALQAAINEMVNSFEFAPSVEAALEKSKAKLLTSLEAKKGSTPEALQRYEAAKAAIAAMKFDLVPLNKALNIIRRSFDMQEQVYLSLSEQRANVGHLASMISSTAGLNADQSRKVAEAFAAAYEAEMNRRIQKTLTNYAKRRSMSEGRGAAERYSRSERFLRLARIGGLRQEEFYNAMATEFDLPSYDPVVAEELDREAQRILAMPVGSVQRNDATRELNARIVNETYKSLLAAFGAKAIIKDRGMLAEYIAGVPVAMWKAGVLSGFGTSEVNLIMGTVQSVMDLGFNSVAYAVKAKDPALAGSNLLTLMRAVGWIADPAARSEVWSEMKRAALTGRTRFASEQSENMLILERDLPTLDTPGVKQLMGSTNRFYKLIGRIGAVIDATVSVPASIARQRLALQYALTMSGADRKKITEIMRKSFSPDEIESREINEILEAEAEQFRNSPRPDLAMKSRRFQLLEQRRAQTYAELTSRLSPDAKEDFMEASRESGRFANLGTTPTGFSGLIFDGIFGAIERKTKGASSIIVSFPRAMGNLLDFSLAMSVPFLSYARAKNRSPSSWFLSEESRYKRELVEKGSIKYHKLMAQNMFALAVQATIGTLFVYGLEDEEEGRVPWFMIYGKGYTDTERNRQLRYRQPKWAPYTVKIGGLYLSWKDIPGFNLLMGGLAAISDDQLNMGLKDPNKVRKLEAAANTAVAFIKAVTVKNSLQGLAQAGELLSDNTFAEAMTFQNVVKMGANFVSGATNPRLIRELGDMGRGLAGGGEYTLKDTRGLTAAAISLLPANSLYGEALGQRDMLNSMGEPVTNFWYAPVTKRILPVTAGPTVNPIITPLVSAGLFISPPKASRMTLDSYKDDSDEIEEGGALLSSFQPEVESDALRIFGEQMRLSMTPDVIEDLVLRAGQNKVELEAAQKDLDKISERAREHAREIIQERIYNREIVPHWQE